MGGFRSIRRSIAKIAGAPIKFIKHNPLTKAIKPALPIIGSIAGGYFGGPLGASLGGALGGGLSSKNHRLDHMLGGGLMGLGHGILTPMLSPSLGQSMGLGGSGTGAGIFDRLTGGVGGLGGSGAREGAFNSLKNVGAQGGSGGGGLLSGLFGGSASGGGSGGGILGNLGGLNGLLLAGALGGKLLGKSKMPKYGTPENESMQQAVQRNRHDWGDPNQYFPKVAEKNQIQFPPDGYRGTGWNFFPTPQEQEEQLRRVNEEIAQYANAYKRGGRVSGYYKGSDGGQSDKRRDKVEPDTFIMDGTTLSLAGDGNSDNGAHVIKDWANSFMQGGCVRDTDHRRKVNIFVSDGELKLSPKEVKAIGGGSIDKGVKHINKMRRGLRKHKGLTKFLPPKSKSLDKYAGIKR